MKNLKRTLCLVLVCVMTLGLMVMTTGAADFTDKNEIVNTDAVDTMVALDIINGKDDGSYFDPTGIVTRAEMCKMICVALNGGKDPQLGTTAYSYTDTNGTWAAGYIEYCTNLGIVAGRGNGTFDPTGTVTGTEAAKMLLVAIGYDPAAEGFTGASWAVAVNVRANQKDLYEDLEDMDPSAGLTRDNAAQMVFNAIQAVMVEYDYSLTTSGGQLSTVAKATDMGDDDTILVKKFAMDTGYGLIYDFSYDDTKEEWTYDFALTSGTVGKYTVTDPDNEKKKGEEAYFTSDGNYTDLWARSVKVLSKTNSTKTTIYGIFPDDSVVLATGTLDSITITSGVYDSFKIGSTVYKMDDEEGIADTGAYEFHTSDFICNLDAIPTAGKPFEMQVIDDDNDGKVDYVIAVPFTVQKVTYVGSTAFTTTAGSVTTANVNVYDGIAKNDFVKIVSGYYTADEKDTYTKVGVISGTVSATKDSGATFKIDGTYYKIAANAISGTPASVDAGDKYEKIAIVNGYAFNMAEVSGSTAKDYAVVVGAVGDDGLNGDQAKLLFTDGTKKVVAAASDYSTDGLDYVGVLVTYTVNSDDEYVLTLASAKVEEDNTGFDTIVAAPAEGVTPAVTASYAYAKDAESTIGGNGTGTNYDGYDYIASDAVVFIKDNGSWKVITGEALYKSDSITGVLNAYAESDSSTGLDTIKLACVTGTTTSGEALYGYVTATPEVVENDDDEQVYSVIFWDGSKSVTANTTNLASDFILSKNDIIMYTYDGSDIEILHFASLSPGNVGAVTAYSSSTDKIRFAYDTDAEDIDNDGEKEYVIDDSPVTDLGSIDDDTVVLYIDRANAKGVDGGEIQLATKFTDEDDNDYYIANCFFVLSGTDVVLLVIDVHNDILDGAVADIDD